MYLNGNNKFIDMQGIVCIDVTWFQDVGIVICQDMITYEYKSYIKSVLSTQFATPTMSGEALENEIDKDVAKIMAYGNTFPLETAKALFSQYEFIEGNFFKDIIDKYPEHFI